MLGTKLAKQAPLKEAILLIILIFGLFYLALTYLHAPKKKEVKNLKAKVVEIEKKLSTTKKLNKALENKFSQSQKRLDQELEEAAQDDPLVLMLKQFKNPIFKNISEFLHAVIQLKLKTNIDITSMNHHNPIKEKCYFGTNFHIDLNGRFSNVLSFLKELERIPSLLTIDKIDLSVGKNNTSEVIVKLQGTFYRLET
jgi:type IV pilus assembly protein PilO